MRSAESARVATLIALGTLYVVGLTNYGSVTATGRLIFELLILLSTALATVLILREERLHLPNRRTFLAALLLLGYAGLQIFDSIRPESGLRALVHGSHYLLLFFALVATLNDRRILRGSVAFLLLLAIALSAWGIARASGAGELLIPGWNHAGSYVNRNHFAALLGMLFPPAFYSGLGLRSRTARGGTPLEQPWFFFGLAVIVLCALLLTRSLGGLLAFTVIAVAILADRVAGTGDRKVQTALAGVLLMIAGAGVFALWFGHEPITDRLARAAEGRELSALERVEFWRAALAVWAGEPALGTGMGTFDQAFVNHRPADVPYGVRFAHNEWLQLLAEAGIAGLLLVIVLIGAMLSYAFDADQPVRSNYLRRLGRGALLGLLFLGVNALGDFPLHIPGNAAVAVFLMAALTNSAALGEARADAVIDLKSRRWAKSVICAGAFALIGVLGWQDVTVMLGECHHQRAIVASEQEDFALAATEARQAISWRKRTPAYHHTLGKNLVSLGRRASTEEARSQFYKQARETLARAAELSPRSPRIWSDYGQSLYLAGAFEEAERAFLKGVELGPNDPWPLFARGRFHWQLGKPALAALDFRRALEIDPRLTEKVSALFARALPGTIRERATLVPLFESAMPDTAGAHVHMASVYRKAGLEDLALEELRRGYHRDPDDRGLLINLVNALYAAHYDETAREVLQHYTARHPGDAGAMFMLGQAQARTDRWADAIEAYRRALELKPDQPNVYLELATALHRLGRDEGYEFWQTLVERFPENPSYRVYLARDYTRRGRLVEAIRELRIAVGRDPDNVGWRNELASLLLRRRLHHEAIAQWKAIAELRPNQTNALLAIARTYRDLDLDARARQYYERVLELSPNNTEARNFLTAIAR